MLPAAFGSVLFLLVAPGVVGGLVPWLLTGWRSSHPATAMVVLGAALIALGTGVLLHAFGRFVFEGRGTPAPTAPTERLVVGGVYRHVRNPMYLAVGRRSWARRSCSDARSCSRTQPSSGSSWPRSCGATKSRR